MSKKKHPSQADPKDSRQADQVAEKQSTEKPPIEETPIEETAVVDNSSDELEGIRAELEEVKDRALRSQAELENFRKRAARELRDERRYAAMPLIRDLLPIWDNVGRAIKAAEQHEDTNSLLEGFKIVAQQFVDVLKSHNCTEIESLHEPFDPHLHEAIFQQPSDEYPANTVLTVVQTGFLLHDRVVRPTQVIVSVDAPPPVDDNG